MSDPTLITDLIRAGVDPELVGRVANALAEFRRIPDLAAERRRAKDRDRKRLQAERSKHDAAEIPRNSETALILSSSSQKNSDYQEGKKVRARKTQLSAEFQPKQSHFDAAARLKYPNPRQAVLDKCEDMRVWAHGKGEARADWDATLHGFLRRDAKQREKHNGKSVLDAFDRLEQQLTSGGDNAPREGDLLSLPPR